MTPDHSALIERMEETDPLRIDFTAERREAAAALRDLTARLDDANQSICAFAAPWAATYARDFGLPEGSLHATHFDILEAAGARMVSFTRHDPSAPNQAKEAGE